MDIKPEFIEFKKCYRLVIKDDKKLITVLECSKNLEAYYIRLYLASNITHYLIKMDYKELDRFLFGLN